MALPFRVVDVMREPFFVLPARVAPTTDTRHSSVRHKPDAGARPRESQFLSHTGEKCSFADARPRAYDAPPSDEALGSRIFRFRPQRSIARLRAATMASSFLYAKPVMNPVNLAQLLLLAALWGGSFLFIRVGVTDLGVAPLMALRVGIGAAFLLIVLMLRGSPREAFATMRERAWPLFVVGVFNSAAPFCLFAYAELTLTAGVTSVINATTPLWGALVAYLWLGDRLSRLRVAGLAIGFAGVMALVWDQMFVHDATTPAIAPMTTALAALAALAATLCYGIAASYTKRYLTGVDSLTVAAGTMSAATLVLIPFALVAWPAGTVSLGAWGAVLGLGIACTGVAYMVFFHLIAVAGPARAITVTFVIPIFGILWGALFLAERVSAGMAAACAVVLAGTALATGVVKRVPLVRERRAACAKQ
jgi:drug/metabolite transporter (DMT)-like permease